MNKFEIKSIFESLLSKHKVWWHDHQSYKECVIGSDGVGHDYIHPVDQFRASLRNLWSLTSAVYGYKLKVEEDELKIEKLMYEIEHNNLDNAKMWEFKDRELKIELERAQFGLMCSKMQFEDRLIALKAFFDHSNSLYEKVKDKYKDFDDALEDIWTARLAYQALVGGHPLGNNIKIALMDEQSKLEALKSVGFPIEQFRTPNAKEVLEAIESHKKMIKERSNGERLLD